ncbi:MAG: hypothetical protein M1594_01455 [Candidatus Marsarchaeota archaeon]|nr:hypothetical protein [Candidatus Marsarchaeota archaeon]
MNNLSKVLLSLFLIGVFASAAVSALGSSNGAALQISNYTVIPSTVYPGTTGYVQLTLSNTGSDTATGITAYYNYLEASVPTPLSEGNLAPSSIEQITIPFEVPQQVSSGLYLINIGIYYSASSTVNNIQETSLSIPLVISQQQSLQVQMISTSSSIISPGNSFSVEVAVINNGGSSINNLIVTSPSNSSFSIQGASQQSIGNVNYNSSVDAVINLTSSSITTPGQYTIPLEFQYNNALGATVSQVLNIGPVTIAAPMTSFILSMNPLTNIEVGGEANFNIKIQNTESNVESYLVNLNLNSSVFVPLNQSLIYLGPVAPGQSTSQVITLGISNGVMSGYYQIPLQVTLASGQTVNQNIGVYVTATPGFTVTSSSGVGGIIIEVANTGNTEVRSVFLSASSKELNLEGTSNQFVGTMNIDDIATLPLTVSSSQLPQAGQNLGNFSRNFSQQSVVELTVSFKDLNNIPYTFKYNVTLTPSELMTASSGSTFRSRQAGIVFLGIDLIEWVEIIIVLAVIYFIYTRYFKKKEVKK